VAVPIPQAWAGELLPRLLTPRLLLTNQVLQVLQAPLVPLVLLVLLVKQAVPALLALLVKQEVLEVKDHKELPVLLDQQVRLARQVKLVRKGTKV